MLIFPISDARFSLVFFAQDIPEHADESSTSVDDGSGMGLTIASNNAGGEDTDLAMASSADR